MLSGTIYDGTHSIVLMDDAMFNSYVQTGKIDSIGYNSWKTFWLIPTSRPVIVMPKEKSKTVDLPGCDGLLDISEVLTGYMLYGNRSGNLQFIVDNWHKSWSAIRESLVEAIHGKRLKMILTDEPMYYYDGRFFMDNWASEATNSKVVIRYDLQPYKHDVWGSTGDWLWDPFNFEIGVIRNYGNLTVNGSLSLVVVCGQEHSMPTITCSTAMTLTYNRTTYNLNAGANTPIRLVPGNNTLVFTGNGTVTVDYRRGLL